MADPPRDVQAAKRRASFARAERLRRERVAGHQAKANRDKNQAKKRDPARPTGHSAEIRAALRDREKRLLEHLQTPEQKQRIRQGFARYHRILTRDDAYRARNEAQKQERAAEQDRNDKKQDTKARQPGVKTASATEKSCAEGKRVETARDQENVKKDRQRSTERRQSQAKKTQDKHRDRIRLELERKAAGRRAEAVREARRRRDGQLKEIAKRARADIEAAHTRQRDEQQQQHRRETDQMRSRHARERDSFRRNENDAIARHAGAINRIDGKEQRELDALAGKHSSLQGRIAGLRPGAEKAREQARQDIRERHTADRMKTHRDHEAYKERSFTREQATRLQHTQDRFVAMGAHRQERQVLHDRQAAQRPQQIEQRQRAIATAQEQTRSQEQKRSSGNEAQSRGPWKANDLTEAFNRAR